MKRLAFVVVLSFAMALLASACDEGQDAEAVRAPTATVEAEATTTSAPVATERIAGAMPCPAVC